MLKIFVRNEQHASPTRTSPVFVIVVVVYIEIVMFFVLDIYGHRQKEPKGRPVLQFRRTAKKNLMTQSNKEARVSFFLEHYNID